MNKLFFVLLFVMAAACGSLAQQTGLPPEHQIAHDIFKELIEINTTDTSAGDVTTAAEAMAARFQAAGIPAYGVPGVFTDVDDDRAHGRDERIGVKDFYDGVDFYYEFIKAMAAQ